MSTVATDALLEEIQDLIREREREGVAGLAERVGPAEWAALVPRLDRERGRGPPPVAARRGDPPAPRGARPARGRRDPPDAQPAGGGNRPGRHGPRRRRRRRREPDRARGQPDPRPDGPGRGRRDPPPVRLRAGQRRRDHDPRVRRGHDRRDRRQRDRRDPRPRRPGRDGRLRLCGRRRAPPDRRPVALPADAQPGRDGGDRADRADDGPGPGLGRPRGRGEPPDRAQPARDPGRRRRGPPPRDHHPGRRGRRPRGGGDRGHRAARRLPAAERPVSPVERRPPRPQAARLAAPAVRGRGVHRHGPAGLLRRAGGRRRAQLLHPAPHRDRRQHRQPDGDADRPGDGPQRGVAPRRRLDRLEGAPGRPEHGTGHGRRSRSAGPSCSASVRTSGSSWR